ncbi:hypothetical protein [Haloarchaeobius iranensis]|uniref:Uncharacterized protein n=1 Tax=Haloarchaeobius iranensis TaxID=996166 RepID=A0A1G9YM14_9EURY|nr:hypothetical protein [Haloarchaeobius iranensis]SDN10057.1 hypothetical protein SAMN05192554_11534 [Haloarchaeobius iranensis]
MVEDEASGESARRRSRGPRLASRIFVTWVGLVAVGFLGALLGGFASGPPELVVYLATVLALVAVFMYNVDRLVTARLQDEQ